MINTTPTIWVFIIHNNEGERLHYMASKIASLDACLKKNFCTRVTYVGPEFVMRSGAAGDTIANRIRRARAAVKMHSQARRIDPRSTRRPSSLKHYWEYIFKYQRSIRVEQDVYAAHLTCWALASSIDGFAIILESDAIFEDGSEAKIANLMLYLRVQAAGRLAYVDLAGGCNREKVLNAWCLEKRFGCVDFNVPSVDYTVFHDLPRLVTNTVGGYIITSSLAHIFSRLNDHDAPLVPPDWAINLFAFADQRLQNCRCIHSTPTILRQGSADGTYASTIEPS